MLDTVFQRFRWYRALKGGVWTYLRFMGANNEPIFMWSNAPRRRCEDSYIVKREFYSPFEPEEFHDGYHSVAELYKQRSYLFCCFLHVYGGWKSRIHADGSSYEGYFIAGCELDGKPITFHLPDRFWDICPVGELARGKEWDGHTSLDVLRRMRHFCAKPSPWSR